MKIIDLFVLLIIVLIFLCGLFKKVNIIDTFTEGAKNGLKSGLLISIVFPILLIVACAYIKKKEKNK